jgi:hypothetical protein
MVNYVTTKPISLDFMKNKKTSIGSNLWYICHHKKTQKITNNGIICWLIYRKQTWCINVKTSPSIFTSTKMGVVH